MAARRIIPRFCFLLSIAILSLRLNVARAQQPVEYPPPGSYWMEPAAEDCSVPKPVLIEPQPQVWVQPSAPMEMVPIMPLPQSAGPMPPSMVGPMFGAPAQGGPSATFGAPEQLPPPAEAGSPEGPLENIAPGGSISPRFGLPRGPEAVPGTGNPIFIPAANDEQTWEQIVDVVNRYFAVGREQQVRRSGEAWSEGRIETRYQNGASWLEPWRKDSVGAFNRWESTFQTIRRKALVRVIPDANGFLVEVVVEKELEDLPHPERASAGVASFPNFTMPSERAGDVNRTLSSPCWIPLGRDPALEAKMLAEIHARLCGVTTASRPSIWW
jgi:hypothetical protein